jgi:hypothetical protein
LHDSPHQHPVQGCIRYNMNQLSVNESEKCCIKRVRITDEDERPFKHVCKTGFVIENWPGSFLIVA